jgi:signal transduction histidine kinase
MPITFGAVAVPITTALLVGWAVLLGRRIAESPAAGDIGLLVVGAIAFAAVIVILVLLSVFLAREIREVRRQNGFIDSVTHELKSPLASLKLCAETLGRDDLGAPQRRRIREMMLGDVDRLAAFIDDVLQASRLAHGETALNLGDVDVAELVASCADAVAARHRLADGRVRAAVEPGLTVSTDRAALELVLKNLLDNAVKYSRDEIVVRAQATRERGGALVLEVEDRGIGIAPRDLRRVFERFYRADDEAVRAQHGTGLGLFVASLLVRNLGGALTAHSDGAGRGARMRVTLPGARGRAP